MIALEFNELEQLIGGDLAWTCSGAPAAIAVGTTLTILSGGTLGWALLITMAYAATSCGIAASEIGR